MSENSYPNRLTLQSCQAYNAGGGAKSQILEGYTEEEMRSGVEILDADELLEQWQPSNPKSVALLLTLTIGWDDEPWSNCFCVRLITNELKDEFGASSGRSNGGSTIFCEEFDWPKVRKSILNILDKCERPTWDESVEELRKRFDWEYEGAAGT